MLLLAAASVALSLAMAMVPAIFNAVSSAIEAVTDLKTVRRDLEARENRLARQASDAEANAAKLRQDLSAERARHRSEVVDWQRRLDTAEADPTGRPVRYRNRQVAIRDAVGDTSERVSRRVANSSLRNAASTFGEGLPVVGIGVIVAATAWELRDSCQLMLEMRELDAAFNPENPISEDEVCGIVPPTRQELWARIKSSPGAIWEESKDFYNELPDVSLDTSRGWIVSTFKSAASYFYDEEDVGTTGEGADGSHIPELQASSSLTPRPRFGEQ